MNDSAATAIRLSALEKSGDITTANSIAIAKLQADTVNLKEWMAEYEQKFNERINQVALIQVKTEDIPKQDEKIRGIYASIASLEAFKNKQVGYMSLLIVILSLITDAIKSRLIP